MRDGSRSFWSSIPGLITGIAGLLTGVVGLGTLAVQQGIIGKDSASTTATTVSGAVGGAPSTTEAGAFTVNPTALKLLPTEREKEVTVQNSTRTATITVLAPQFSGGDASVFRAETDCSNRRLEAGRSCKVKVLFAPGGLLKSYKTTLVIRADGVAATEIPIEASTIL